jgi:hypothetical protein
MNLYLDPAAQLQCSKSNISIVEDDDYNYLATTVCGFPFNHFVATLKMSA